jgi:hypothetical protein
MITRRFIMKKVLSVFLILTMMLASVLAVIPASAAEATLTTDKDVYVAGEPILVSASSDNAAGTDWVGIAPKGIFSGGALAWEYVRNIGKSYDITKSPNGSSSGIIASYKNYPAGEYVVYLIANDKSLTRAIGTDAVIAQKEIKIVPKNSTLLKAPTAVTYEIDDATSGLADGTLKITLPANHNADDIYMWWANEDGKLEDYTRLARFKVPSKATTEITYKITPKTLIPAEATKLLVYTFNDTLGVSAECFEVVLPEGAGYDFPEEDPITEFQIVSDIHIGYAAVPYEFNFRSALEDMAKNSPNSVGIFSNGDIIDRGENISLWHELWSIYDSVEGAPDFFPGIGNHEYIGLHYESGLSSFLNKAQWPEEYIDDKPDGVPYYDVWVNGYHYIFLASTTLGCKIGDEQYDWFEACLENKVDDRPVFVFLHQSMKDTVAGSSESEGWWQLEDDARMREIFSKHPEIFFFNGHSHWVLDSYNTMYGGGENAAMFNTSSVGYLWHAYDVPWGEHQDGSEGYYVRVYKDRVLLLGRDFINGKWVSSAQFVVNERYTDETKTPDFKDPVNTEKLEALISEVETLKAEDYTEKSWSTFSAALVAAKEALTSEKQSVVNAALTDLRRAKNSLVAKKEEEKDTTTVTEAPTDAPIATDETGGGCGSSFSALGVLLACAAGVAVVATKKRR